MNHNGYAWWYIDALSDDGVHGLTMIAFIGSVFSPYYAWARRRGPADPRNHCALNVALYGPRAKRWSMTERGTGSLSRGAHFLSIGPSHLVWDGTVLTAHIQEVAVPFPRRIHGTVRLTPIAVENRVRLLDVDGRHRWQPIAPCADIEIALTEPNLSWRGRAYFDTNTGDRPLEHDFQYWTWSRSADRAGTTVYYDVTPWTHGPPLRLAMRYDATGGVTDLEPVAPASLPKTRWGIPRTIGTNRVPKLLATWEDTPFYARSIVGLQDETTVAVHETLSLERFRAPWVRAMLPFRMPRVP